ncbi:MAG: lactate utilization protein [Deltaproteobacteria bacterium]|nr:lactate utilization protein [Deltaproteobacteria bacterium]MBW2361907.1 lactate utilization protein [Deltaproteobacteria bacterium]
MNDHASRAAAFNADAERTGWHDRALWHVRERRDRAAAQLPEWEALRDAAGEIKAHTLSQLDLYLERFEQNALQAGASVHWARDADELCSLVHALLESRGVSKVVKSKSMLTEECGLNPHLEARGIEVVDTDLGERIVQLRGEPPSHIVLPAIHIKKEEVGELFHREMGSPEGLDDPTRLTEVARGDLRQRFLAAEAGITGVNFGVAETGGIVVCSNEGNVDLGTALPPLHIACMGIEKLVPRERDLPVFLRLLARSATGQAITSYTSHFHGPRPGGELHIVLVDNGRSQLLSSEAFESALRCIRCGACLNTCPVYRRSGGHSYASVIPGPIGSVLEPARDAEAHASLPFACTLCGSCGDVCPVKIPLSQQLLAWRGRLVERGHLGATRRFAQRFAAAVLARPRLYAALGALGRALGRRTPAFLLRANAWGRSRELPELPHRSFRAEWARRRDGS